MKSIPVQAVSSDVEVAGRPARRVLEVIRPYPFHAAGQTWRIPQVVIEEDYDGTPVMSGHEITRITRAIANEICGDNAALTADELEYLCGLTGVRYVEVAKRLGVTRSTISTWLKNGGKLPMLPSIVLKKWFWYQIFGALLEDVLVFRGAVAFEDGTFLHQLRQEAIQHSLAEPLRDVA